MSKIDQRESFTASKRIVVKIGSALLAHSEEGILRDRIATYCAQICNLVNDGYKVVVVTSGAVAAGMGRLGLQKRPSKINELQAIAAVGQMNLMQAYEEDIGRLGRTSAMILLTHEDFSNRQRYLNARSTLTRLLDLGVIPLINENDTVATDEIRFGDNDTLSAFVTNLIDADLQIILTDVEGLMDKDPNIHDSAEVILKAPADDKSLEGLSSDRTSALGRGGMLSKVRAARLASRSGADTVIASGKIPGILARIVSGEEIGTHLFVHKKSLRSRKRWIADQLKPGGYVIIDSGASEALSKGGASLLAVGVLDVYGNFERGDLIECRTEDATVVAQGLVNYSSGDISNLKGLNSEKYSDKIEHVYENELVHCDNLVLV